MSTRSFSSFSAQLAPSVPGCPQPMLIQYIRDAAIRVCERTLAWRYEQPVFNLTAGNYKYTFQKPDGTEVQALLMATLNNEPLEILELGDATRLYPSWAVVSTTAADIEQNGSEPRSLTQVNPSQFLVLPAPDAAKAYAVRLIYALRPARTAVEMDEAVFNRLERPIMHYALQQLLILPQVGWADRVLAEYHARQFLATVTEARAQANINVGRSTLTAKAPKFA